jgi:hypothetical protein
MASFDRAGQSMNEYVVLRPDHRFLYLGLAADANACSAAFTG